MKLCLTLFFTATLCALADESPVKISLLPHNLLHIRARQVTAPFAEQLHAGQPTNQVTGTILDLREADGDADPAAEVFSTRKTPLIILVNRDTRGTAATLARQLRASGPAVIIGSTNANQSFRPDILVSVSTEAEKKYLENPYFTAPKTDGLVATNELLPFVDHMTEAELVRKKVKDGEDEGDARPTSRATSAQPILRDPVLARAVDLLTAWAALHPQHG